MGSPGVKTHKNAKLKMLNDSYVYNIHCRIQRRIGKREKMNAFCSYQNCNKIIIFQVSLSKVRVR